jgi:putative NADPH-quinone reductase
MSRHILIIQGHPDPAPDHLCRGLGEAYAESAIAAGHVVQRLDLAGIAFPMLASEDAFLHDEVPDSLRGAVKMLRDADHVVLLFPLWLGTMPALVKAFLEQVMRPGIAFAYRDDGLFPRKLLPGKSARIVVTMGMPALLYRWWYGAHGVKALERNILRFVGFAPVRTTLFGTVQGSKPARRTAWFATMRRLGREAS